MQFPNRQPAPATTRIPQLSGLCLPRVFGFIVLIFMTFLYFTPGAHAQRSGDSTTIRAGTVTGSRSVDLRDGNAAGGALVGGAFGAALSGTSSSSRSRNRNAAIGAILGSAVARNQRTTGRVYTVTTIDGSMIQVATEQTEIQIGDCVFVEQSGGGANIRRAPAVACEPESREVMQDDDVEEYLQEEAAHCFDARQELAEAQDDAAFERAVRKVKILCYE